MIMHIPSRTQQIIVDSITSIVTIKIIEIFIKLEHK
jgi:hypothetical protein